MNKIYALIDEGKRERVVLNLLLDNNKLIFSREDILEEEVLTTRSGKTFEIKHLNFKTNKEVHVYRVLDSSNERFVVKANNVIVHDVLTRPEIEMLIIIDLGKYDEFKKYEQKNKGKSKGNSKASTFLKEVLPKYHKGQEYWENYYKNDVERLINNLKEHDKKRPSGEKTIYSLIKE